MDEPDQRMSEGAFTPLHATSVGRDEIMLMHTLMETGRAIRAFRKAEQLVASREESAGGYRREWLKVFDQLRLGLQFYANVSRMFFASRADTKARARHLRELTKIPDDHIIKDRSIRDSVEHLDERLDTWTNVSPRPFSTVEYILYKDRTDIRMEQALRESVLFLFNEATSELSILGQRVSIKELIRALTDVQSKVSEALSSLTAPSDL